MLRILILLLFLASSYCEAKDNHSPNASNAASMVDWLLKQGEKKPLIKPLTSVTARAASLSVFPLCASADMVSNTCQGNFEGAEKCFVGILSSPAGIISSDLVTHHFLNSNNGSKSQIIPYGKLYSMHAQQFFPESVEDVKAIVDYARHTQQTVSVIGKGMSQGKQALPSEEGNIAVNLSQMNKVVIDPINKIANVQAGASWSDVQNEANKYGLAVKVMQASNIFSIGGSISVNCHGWDHKSGSLRHTLLSFTLVNSAGVLEKITPNHPLFNYVLGGYGCFGIVTNAMISLTDNIKLRSEGVEISPDNYVNYFYSNVLGQSEIDMHLYRLSLEPGKLFNSGVAMNYRRHGDTPYRAGLFNEPERGKATDKIKLHAIRRLGFLRSYAWQKERASMLKPAVATRNEIMRPPINVIFNDSNVDTEWLQEYFVRGESLAPFLKFLAQVLQKNSVPVFNASVRYVKQDPDSILSYSQNSDHFAVVLFFNQKLTRKEIKKTRNWVRQVIDYLIENEGTYYLPYQHFATQDQFKECYPNFAKVINQKNLFDPTGMFSNGFYNDYFIKRSPESKFRHVFSRTNGQRKEIDSFLKNVFMQLNEEAFFSLIDTILDHSELDDVAIYEKLSKNIDKAKPNAVSGLKHSLDALWALKQDLAKQVNYLVDSKTDIKGYVEIGYNGRMVRPLKKYLNISDPIYVINESEAFSDYIEAGGTRPYDKFIQLNDYEPISEWAIPTASVDMVCMYIGLHHIPPEKIDTFVASIKRILRPGGMFILMDHDAYTDELKELADVVHSIFNAATNVSPEENQLEVRNFQALQYWIDVLQKHGLVYHPSALTLIRKGDPTLNTLIRFDNPISYQDSIVLSFNSNPDVVRPQQQTFLTAPEWQNVWASKRYADHLQNQPAHTFPYFQEIGGFWNVFANSWNASREEHSLAEVALSDSTLMNVFVGSMMTLEYGLKGVTSYVGQAFNVQKGDTLAENERSRALSAYAKHIEHTPFYMYQYSHDTKDYWNAYRESLKTRYQQNGFFRTLFSTNTLKDSLRGVSATLENTTKSIISTPIAWFYSFDSTKEETHLFMLVKDPQDIVSMLDERIEVIHKDQIYTQIKVPRYFEFKEILMKIAEHNIEVLSIAGQQKIQVDIRFNNKGTFLDLSGCKKLYTIPSPQTYEVYEAYLIDVKMFAKVVETLKAVDGEILYIHDF